MSACRPLQMPPTAKSVLMAMADYSDDGGECWPSIYTLCRDTCFSERAIHGAIKWLEAAGLVTADRSNGRHTRYLVTPEAFQPPQEMHPRSKCGGAGDAVEPQQEMQQPPQQVQSPPQELRSNRKEPSRTTKATTKRVVTIELPEWLPREAWNDWADHRKKIKSAMTPRAAELSIEKLAEYREQGFSPGRVINNAIERGWRGLFTSGLTPDLKQPTQSKPGASGDFRGKSYTGTAIDDLPPDLRDAARAALADG